MKNILIAVSGLTPQVVTETLFCLSIKQNIKIDEIYVLTTVRGREVILGKDKAASTPKTTLLNEIAGLCKLYNIPLPLFLENDKHIIVAKEGSIELSDIRSDKDNILFPNKAANFIREKSLDPDTVIYCSITGGRKSMSVHINNALSLFARENDKLLHVLTSVENEFKGFYPVNKKESKALELSQLPFVRLRSLIAADIKGKKLADLNYDEVVRYTQKQLKLISGSNNLICDIEKRQLIYSDESISLEPIEFLLYFFFVESKMKGKNKLNIHEITSRETSSLIREYITSYFKHYYIREVQLEIFNKGFDAEYFRSRRSKINNKIKELIKDQDIAHQFIIEVDKKYGDSRYFIPASKARIKIILPF